MARGEVADPRIAIAEVDESPDRLDGRSIPGAFRLPVVVEASDSTQVLTDPPALAHLLVDNEVDAGMTLVRLRPLQQLVDRTRLLAPEGLWLALRQDPRRGALAMDGGGTLHGGPDRPRACLRGALLADGRGVGGHLDS